MSRLRAFWQSSIGKKAVMATTGAVYVGYVVAHMLGNLQFFQGSEKINGYAAFLQGQKGLLWTARAVLLVSLVFHVLAAYQLTRRSAAARPVGYAKREPQVSTVAVRAIRWGGVLLLAFIVFHVFHFTIFAVDPGFTHGDVYGNLMRAFRSPGMALFYLAAMVALGLHLYHGVWSGARSLGVAPPAPAPLKRRLALVLAVLLWLGFSAIPVAILLGIVR